MKDPQTTSDKMATAAADVSASVQEAAHEGKPAFERLAERLSDSISDMAHHSRDTAIETRKLLAQKHTKPPPRPSTASSVRPSSPC